MAVEQQRRSGGRRNRGERSVVSTRPPVDDKAVWQQLADELDITLGSYVVLTVNKAAGLGIPDYVQEELNQAAARKSQLELEDPHMRKAS